MFHNVCRLCLGTEELIWIFNEKMADNMPEIIEVTSGVQITKSDTVTQMVCSTCCQITIKMYKFRTTSIKNDKDLKARCAGYNISQLRNSIVQTKQEITSSSAAAVAASPNTSSSENSTTLNASVTSTTRPPPAPTPPVPKFQIPQKYKFAHPSIKEIVKHNPNVQLQIPEASIRSHFGAYITLLTDEVDDWYKERNFTDSQIVEIKKTAVSYATELENPTPKPLRKKRRKSSIESASSSSSKKSSSDKSVTESGVSKRKKPKLNGEFPLKANAETVADKAKGSSMTKPKANTIPKMFLSMINPSVSAVDKTNVQTSSKSGAYTTVKLDSNSNSKLILFKALNTSVKTESSNIPKGSANVSTKYSASVSSAKTDVGSTITNVSSTEQKPKETLQLGSVLHALLPNEVPRKSGESEITLSSILRSRESTNKYADAASDSDGNDAGDDPSYQPEPTDGASDAEVIEIEEPGKKNDRLLRPKTDQPQNRTKPKDEYTLFTTRPFVRNATNVRQSKLDLRAQNCEGAELLILSDSDDEPANGNEASNKKPDNGSNISDPIIVDIDSSEASSLQSSKDNSDQDKPTNMPDLSLITVTNKSTTLFICKVCDGHYHNLKDLKVHERRTHTKCPFCNKKFRSLGSRDEHVKYTCIINNAPFELKNIRLELTRVDEVEEIRKQYASAFEEMEYISEETVPDAEVPSTEAVSETVPPSVPPSASPQQAEENTGEKRNVNQATADAVSEFERFLQAATRPPSQQISNVTITEGNGNSNETIAAESVVDEVSTSGNNCDIICISDDEADTSSTKEPPSQPKIRIINNDALTNINLQDSDINVLKNILAKARLNKTGKTVAIDALKNNSIIDGGTSRVKVFKDLRKHLQHYKIPIEIQYNPNLNVEYKYAATSPQRKLDDLWKGMVPLDLKVPTVQPQKPPSYNTSVATIPPSYNSTVANIPPPYNTTVATAPPSYSTAVATLPNSQIKNASLLLRTQQSSNVSQIVTSTKNIFNSVVSQSPVFATMAQVAPIVSSTLGSAVSSSSNLIFTSQPPQFVTSTINDHCYSNRPMVISNAQTLCATSTTNNITNFILVSGTLVPTAEKKTEKSLPAAQGPLPIIQYVTSAQEQPEQPITITDESSGPQTSSTTTATTVTTMQPAIRVKNLSELS